MSGRKAIEAGLRYRSLRANGKAVGALVVLSGYSFAAVRSSGMLYHYV